MKNVLPARNFGVEASGKIGTGDKGGSNLANKGIRGVWGRLSLEVCLCWSPNIKDSIFNTRLFSPYNHYTIKKDTYLLETDDP